MNNQFGNVLRKICQANDKEVAVREMLSVTDYAGFIDKSAYGI